MFLKQSSDVVVDQAKVWGNIGWAAEEITVLKDRMETLAEKELTTLKTRLETLEKKIS